jgi:hypothetical protein
MEKDIPCIEESMNSQSLGTVSTGARDRRLADIAKLSVDVVASFSDKYPPEIVEAFAFIAKYMTIAALDKDARKDISEVVNPEHCPLCVLHFSTTSCDNCVLVHPRGIYCGDKYTDMRSTVESGTFSEAAFHVGRIARDILKKGGDQ